MSFTKKARLLLILVFTPMLVVGCGKGKAVGDPVVEQRKAQLAEIYEVFELYVKNHQRPPKRPADLKQYGVVAAAGVQAVEKGECAVVWGVNPKEGSDAVLAYVKDAPKQGGMVLLANGSIKQMSAEELQAALKAKG